MAEQLYRLHNNLIIGQVDCTQSRPQCELYGVQAFPEIIYITKRAKVKYEGIRTIESMISFAHRVHGPDVIRLNSCKQVKEIAEQHGVILVSSIRSSSSKLRQDYEAIAQKLKAKHWFYQLDGQCDDFIDIEGVYLIKRHLGRAIKFVPSDKMQTTQDNQLSMENWINLESFPIYAQLLGSNLNQLMTTNKPIVVAILDFNLSASKFTRSSYEFHRAFERFARKYVQKSDDFVFAWTRDLSLIETISLQSVIAPNLIIIKPDMSYLLLISDHTDLPDKPDKTLPDKLRDYTIIEEVLSKVKSDSIKFHGGSGYLDTCLRSIYGQYMRFKNVYKNEPIMATVLLALPTTIIVYIMYLIFSEQKQQPEDELEQLISSNRSGHDEDESLTEDGEDECNNSCSGDASAEVSTRSSDLGDDFEPIEMPDDAAVHENNKPYDGVAD